jgi:phosphoribosylamine---glycine ligase
MRILVVGNGAREDALSWALARSPSTTALFAAPGNAGTASRGSNWRIGATDGRALAARCREERIDLVVVGPETAIAAGVTEKLREAHIPVFGPSRSAGRLETSKLHAKRFMERCGVPTARFAVAHSLASADRALEQWSGGCVVKADGLAAGKGVVVADSADEARALLRDWYGAGGIPGGGGSVLLEERLQGREMSLFAIGDGKRFTPFTAACDYKRAGDGDTGPNTGGMGAYSPPAGFSEGYVEVVQREILDPVLAGLRDDGEEYVGVLYCGLMWTESGPKVIEFNVRFGDPETQVLMPRMRGDFAAYLMSAARGDFDPSQAQVAPDPCVGVVLASAEYPSRSTPVAGLPADLRLESGQAFWGASTLHEGRVDAAGGRVLTVTAVGENLEAARQRAYAAVAEIAGRFGAQALSYRRDIALGVR